MLLFFTSCKKYLTEKPTSGFTADFVYNTPEGLEAGVVALYSFQRAFWENLGNNGSNAIVIDSKDDIVLNRNAEVANYGRMFCGTTPDNDCGGVYSNYWRTYYRIIDRANAIIKAAESRSDKEQARMVKVIAEAKFFRANSIFTLYKLFNNIYVTTEPTTPENALNIIADKTSVADIYKQINDDLTYAIANLSWTTTEFGRITQGAARHVKADVALWQQNWAEAKAQSEAVINNGTHSLVSSTALVFKGDLKNSENLWVLQWKTNVNGTAHKINFNLMPNYAELTPGSKYTIEQAGRGFGWLTMNNYIRDLLAVYPTDTRIKGTYYIKDYLYNDPATLPAGQTLGSIIRDNPNNTQVPWKEFATAASDRNGFFIRQNAGCKKYFPDDGIPTEDLQTKNIAVYRFAETLLFAAEANMMLGDNATAITQLNRVRNRAGVPNATGITIDSILYEQAKELAFEGRRLYMLKRLGKLYDYIVDHSGYGKAGDLTLENSAGHANTPADPFPFRTDSRRSMKPWMVNWPIPRSEINLLGPAYPQNTGY
jgi:hypothetical protein